MIVFSVVFFVSLLFVLFSIIMAKLDKERAIGEIIGIRTVDKDATVTIDDGLVRVNHTQGRNTYSIFGLSKYIHKNFSWWVK